MNIQKVAEAFILAGLNAQYSRPDAGLQSYARSNYDTIATLQDCQEALANVEENRIQSYVAFLEEMYPQEFE